MKNKAITTAILFLAGIFILALDVVPVAATPDGSIVGLWHLDKKFGTALSFDGINDYVKVPDSDTYEVSTGTIELWFKTDTDYTDTNRMNGYLIGKQAGVGHSTFSVGMFGAYHWPLKGGKLFFWIRGSNSISLESPTRLDDGAWHHVAGVWGSEGMKLYIDGVEVASDPYTGWWDGNTAPLGIGNIMRGSMALPYAFDGVIDEVRISNVPYDTFDLTGPLTADGNTVALWHFNDALDTTASDSSGNENNGTLHNFAPPNGWVDTTLAPDTSTNNNFGTIYGAAWTTLGAYDGALSFDGDDYVEVAHSTSMDVSSNYTFEAWVYLTDDSDYRGLFRRGTRGVIASEIEIYIHPDWAVRKLVVAHNREGAFWGYRYFTEFPLNQWVYLAVTWDGTTVRAYYNAVEQTSISGMVMVDPAVSDKPSFIGLGYFAAYTLGNTPYMIGDIDEVRIWDRALTAEEVYTCYKSKRKVLPIAGPIIWTSAFKVPKDEISSVTIYIWPSDPSITIDHVGYKPRMPFTPKSANGEFDLPHAAPLPHSITITGIHGDCKTMHLWLYLSTGEHIGVNVQFR